MLCICSRRFHSSLKAPLYAENLLILSLGRVKPIYLADLSSYNHVLKQRNTYLKANDKVDETFLSVLDEQQLILVVVMQYRLDFLLKS